MASRASVEPQGGDCRFVEKKKDVGLILKGAYVLFYVLKADTEGAVSTGEEKDGKDDGNGAGQTST